MKVWKKVDKYQPVKSMKYHVPTGYREYRDLWFLGHKSVAIYCYSKTFLILYFSLKRIFSDLELPPIFNFIEWYYNTW